MTTIKILVEHTLIDCPLQLINEDSADSIRHAVQLAELGNNSLAGVLRTVGHWDTSRVVTISLRHE